ncbi:Dnah12 [Symbiodinium natans]|uniref:Dnah12 protein n=1 Tax=Symbiodinium natans TaxID=878477 RepID=A0A812N5X3_9DINO|nr:Dnah12 [Symbiodinium natans]
MSAAGLRRMSLTFLLSLFALGLAQEAPTDAEAAVPAPPPPAPVPPVVVPAGTPELTGDELVALHRNQYLQALAAAGHNAKRGAWLYGDYINEVDGVKDPLTCAQKCTADAKCYHWNFHVERQRCDLKAPNGGVNEDIGDWITGDVPRAPPAASDL